MCRVLSLSLCLLVLIAQAVYLLQHGQTDTHKLTDTTKIQVTAIAAEVDNEQFCSKPTEIIVINKGLHRA